MEILFVKVMDSDYPFGIFKLFLTFADMINLLN